MKLLIAAFVLQFGVLARAEPVTVQITPSHSMREGFQFAVFAVPMDRAPGLPKVHWVAIEIKPPSRVSQSVQKAYFEVWKDESYLFSTALSPSSADDLPLALFNRRPSRDAMLFSFRISSECLRDSLFFFQLPRKNTDSEAVNCVVRLFDFLQ